MKRILLMAVAMMAIFFQGQAKTERDQPFWVSLFFHTFKNIF